MKLSLQQKKMGEIHELLSQDLSYIFGERESGPNGAKKDFLRKSAAFLRQLGKDLRFAKMEVNTNKAGIACSGEVTLYGIWSENNGFSLKITQSFRGTPEYLYRRIKSLKDFTGGSNQWIPEEIFRDMDYEKLCKALLTLNKERLDKEGVAQNAA